MKVIQRSILVMLAIAMSVLVYGQHRGQGGPGFGMLEALKTELNLTEEQEQQFQELRITFHEKMAALLKEAPEDPEALRAARHELVNEIRTAKLNILTEEQKAILEEKRRERFEARNTGERRALHEALRNYREENILPVMLRQRAKLEESITAADQKEIEALRAAFEQARQERLQRRRSGEMPLPPPAEPPLPEERAAVNNLVDKYDAEIESLFTEIEAERKQWEKDIKGIIKEYRPGPKGEGADRPHRRRRPGGRPHPPRMKGMAEGMAKGRFLLLNPNEPLRLPADEGGSAVETLIFPNPAGSINTVNYTVKEGGNVRIELRDKTGQVLQLLLDETRQPGEYQLQVNLGNLDEGVYYYTITGPGAQETKKLVVARK